MMGLNGTWYNELGSKVTLKEGSDGSLVGEYESAVASNGCAKGSYPLSGRTDIPFGGETFGFAVSWHNDESDCNSTTTWAGHYREGGNGSEEILITFWLLVDKAGPGEEWESTLLGKDTFVRQTVAPEDQLERPPQP
jgi:Avidin family